jgi:tetratricopeptide (TPR) repeat protein
VSQPALSRAVLLIVVLVIIVALAISLWRVGMGALVASPPPRFTVLVAGLEGSVEGQSSAELLAAIQEDFSEAGLPPTMTVRTIPDRPTNDDAAAALARARKADLLLWGRVRPDLIPGYFLTLTVIPVHDIVMAPEFAEYDAVMLTPTHFSLNQGGNQGLSKEDAARALTWVTRFYTGAFVPLEGLPPAEMRAGGLSAALFQFHWLSLCWLKGDYEGVQTAYGGLGCPGEYATTGTALLPRQKAWRALCLAATNNWAVTRITQESLGQSPGSSLDAAISALDSIVQAAPDMIIARYNLGRAYLARGRWGDAVKTLVKVVTENPRHAAAWAALSEASTEAGDLPRARDAAAQAINLDSGLVTAGLAQGRYLLAFGSLQEADRVLGQALQSAERETTRRRAQEAAMREGPRANQKRADYTAAWAHRNDAVVARMHLARARVYLRQGQIEGEPSFFLWLWRLIIGEQAPLEKADAEIQLALEFHPEWAAVLRIQAQLLIAQGALDDAIAMLRRLQEQDQNDLGTYQDLIAVLRRQWRQLRQTGHSQEAGQKLVELQAEYQLLIDRGVAPALGYFGLGDVAQENGDWDKAREAFQQAIAVDKAYAEAYLRLGQVELHADDEARALDYFSQALQASADKGTVAVAAHVERGDIFLAQFLRARVQGQPGQTEDARKEYEAARAQDGRAVRALNGLGRIAYEAGDVSTAEGFYRQAQAVDGRNFDMLYGLGRVYEARGQSGTAADYLRQALGVRGDSIAAHYHLGVAYYALLDETLALQNLEWVQGACPSLAKEKLPPADDTEACAGVEDWLKRINAGK